MEKCFSREFSTNKTSWQSLLTSIINCYSLDHGKSCIVGHIWRHSGRVKGKSIGSLKGKQLYRRGEKPHNDLDNLTANLDSPIPYLAFSKAKRQRKFKISLYFSSMRNELFSSCSAADSVSLTIPAFSSLVGNGHE